MLKMFVNHLIKTPTYFGQTRVTEKCGGFNDVIYKHF